MSCSYHGAARPSNALACQLLGIYSSIRCELIKLFPHNYPLANIKSFTKAILHSSKFCQREIRQLSQIAFAKNLSSNLKTFSKPKDSRNIKKVELFTDFIAFSAFFTTRLRQLFPKNSDPKVYELYVDLVKEVQTLQKQFGIWLNSRPRTHKMHYSSLSSCKLTRPSTRNVSVCEHTPSIYQQGKDIKKHDTVINRESTVRKRESTTKKRDSLTWISRHLVRPSQRCGTAKLVRRAPESSFQRSTGTTCQIRSTNHNKDSQLSHSFVTEKIQQCNDRASIHKLYPENQLIEGFHPQEGQQLTVTDFNTISQISSGEIIQNFFTKKQVQPRASVRICRKEFDDIMEKNQEKKPPSSLESKEQPSSEEVQRERIQEKSKTTKLKVGQIISTLYSGFLQQYQKPEEKKVFKKKVRDCGRNMKKKKTTYFQGDQSQKDVKKQSVKSKSYRSSKLSKKPLQEASDSQNERGMVEEKLKIKQQKYSRDTQMKGINFQRIYQDLAAQSQQYQQFLKKYGRQESIFFIWQQKIRDEENKQFQRHIQEIQHKFGNRNFEITTHQSNKNKEKFIEMERIETFEADKQKIRLIRSCQTDLQQQGLDKNSEFAQEEHV